MMVPTAPGRKGGEMSRVCRPKPQAFLPQAPSPLIPSHVVGPGGHKALGGVRLWPEKGRGERAPPQGHPQG